MLRLLKKSTKNVYIALFSIMVLAGFGLPYFGFGPATTAAAASSLTSASQSGATSGTQYVYSQMSTRDAYPYYIAAAFMAAGGLSLYALTYVPTRAERRSRYASRFETWARTTY